MIYHDIPSNENIPSYHIPIVISIYPINICIYIYEYPIMSILTHYIPIIYPYFWNARHERPHGPSLAPDGRERRHQHCGARTSQRGALGCGGRVMEDLADMGFFSSNRRFLPTTHHSKMYEPKNCVPNLS